MNDIDKATSRTSTSAKSWQYDKSEYEKKFIVCSQL